MAARNGTHGKAQPTTTSPPPAYPAAKAGVTAPRVVLQPPKPVAAPIAVLQPALAHADLSGVFAHVALVHRVVCLCDCVGKPGQAAEAVRACGGANEFLQHPDLVAGITSGPPAS